MEDAASHSLGQGQRDGQKMNGKTSEWALKSLQAELSAPSGSNRRWGRPTGPSSTQDLVQKS